MLFLCRASLCFAFRLRSSGNGAGRARGGRTFADLKRELDEHVLFAHAAVDLLGERTDQAFVLALRQSLHRIEERRRGEKREAAQEICAPVNLLYFAIDIRCNTIQNNTAQSKEEREFVDRSALYEHTVLYFRLE